MIKKLYKSLINTLVSYKKINLVYDEVKNDYKSTKVLLGKMQSLQNRGLKVKKLSEVEFQVFSQFGDDGIIQYLINHLPIPAKTFIEFGVENYRESNTRFLLINDYWSGFIIDGSKSNIETIKAEQYYSFYDLRVEAAFIKKSNINELLRKSSFEKELGILSIDIDGNDFWIWEEIEHYRPCILICEYNSLFGFKPYTIQYQEDFVRGINTPFNFYGTSLKSVFDLSKERGYTFIGCNSAGNNAYFIKNQYFENLSIAAPTLEEGFKFASFSEVWDENRNALRGEKKINSINGLEVYNTETKQIEHINSEEIISELRAANKLN